MDTARKCSSSEHYTNLLYTPVQYNVRFNRCGSDTLTHTLQKLRAALTSNENKISKQNRCPENFTLDSNDTAECNEMGNWSVARPRCLAPCTISRVAPNGFVDLTRVLATPANSISIGNSTASPVINSSAAALIRISAASDQKNATLQITSGSRVQAAALVCKDGYIRRHSFDARCYDGRLNTPLEVFMRFKLRNTQYYNIITCPVLRCIVSLISCFGQTDKFQVNLYT